VKCRYVDYDKDRAVADMKLLMEGKDAEILSKCTTCIACNDYCPTEADPSNLIFQMQEKIGTSPIVAVGKPALEVLSQALEEHAEPVQVIPGDPDKPVLSFDTFQFEQFPEGTLDSQLFKGMTVSEAMIMRTWPAMYTDGWRELRGKVRPACPGQSGQSLGKDIVFIHNEGFVLPEVKAKEYGFKVSFKYMHLFEYLRNYLRDHKDKSPGWARRLPTRLTAPPDGCMNMIPSWMRSSSLSAWKDHPGNMRGWTPSAALHPLSTSTESLPSTSRKRISRMPLPAVPMPL